MARITVTTDEGIVIAVFSDEDDELPTNDSPLAWAVFAKDLLHELECARREERK